MTAPVSLLPPVSTVIVGSVALCILLAVGWFVAGSGQGGEVPAAPTAVADTLTNSIGMQFVRIEAGSFEMGSNHVSDQRPIHDVQITKPFYISRFEVTQEQWQRVMGTTVEQQRDKADTTWDMRGIGPNFPMYYVSWFEAQAFVQRLNEREGTTSYRLPTEAQWEFACRAGSRKNLVPGLNAKAWYGPNAGEQTHPVGLKQPNAWGLHDMQGNVLEWCADWYGAYSAEAQIDPQGLDSGEGRVVRGGGWFLDAAGCEPAARRGGDPGKRNSSLGFRVARR